mgnify:CR=1 FL=1
MNWFEIKFGELNWIVNWIEMKYWWWNWIVNQVSMQWASWRIEFELNLNTLSESELSCESKNAESLHLCHAVYSNQNIKRTISPSTFDMVGLKWLVAARFDLILMLLTISEKTCLAFHAFYVCVCRCVCRFVFENRYKCVCCTLFF